MSFVDVDEMETRESEFWNPEKGEELVGEVVAVKTGSYDKKFLVIETEDGDIMITTQCGSLHNLINKSGVNIGDYVKVVYDGRAPDEYRSHRYKLFIWEDEEEE